MFEVTIFGDFADGGKIISIILWLWMCLEMRVFPDKFHHVGQKVNFPFDEIILQDLLIAFGNTHNLHLELFYVVDNTKNSLLPVHIVKILLRWLFTFERRFWLFQLFQCVEHRIDDAIAIWFADLHKYG